MKRILIIMIAILIVVGGGGAGYLFWQAHHSSSQLESRAADSAASSSSVRKVKKNINLVALGDSLTQGVGDQKKNGGYVGIIKSQIEQKYNTNIHTNNYGVAGDRSDQILKRLDSDQKFQSRLKSADVIVMTVGGNDLMQSLQKNIFIDNQSEFTSKMGTASQKYANKLDQLFKTVRQYNHHAPIFLFSVYNPFYVYFANMDTISKSVTTWNSDTSNELAKYGPAYFVNINNLMSHGQYTTKQSQQKLIKQDQKANTGETSQSDAIQVMQEKDHNLNKYISTDDNFHPNHLGYEKMSAQLFKVMKQHQDWLREEN